VDMGATYDNDSLRGEVVSNLQRAYSLNMETRMACVPKQLWDVSRKHEWATIEKNMVGAENAEVDIVSCFSAVGELAETLESSYARFQDFRRLVAAASHDTLLQRIAVMQGVATLYYGRYLLDLTSGIEAERCSLKPLEKVVKRTKALMSNLVDGQLPALMKRLESSMDRGTSTLVTLEFSVLAGKDVSNICSKTTKELSGGDSELETAVLAWCGYAAFVSGNEGQARTYWNAAGQSVHDPDAASYSLSRLRAMEDGTPAKAVEVELDKEQK